MTQWNEGRRLLGGHDAGKPCGLERVALCDGARRIAVNARRLIVIVPRAIASRSVIGLSPTSTIVTRAPGST